MDKGEEETYATQVTQRVQGIEGRGMKYLFFSAEPEEGGTISVSPEPEENLYPDGTEVMLRAEPAEGWQFVRWAERDYMPRTNPVISIWMSRDRAIAAHFYKPRLT
jgi:hypothetical protein